MDEPMRRLRRVLFVRLPGTRHRRLFAEPAMLALRSPRQASRAAQAEGQGEGQATRSKAAARAESEGVHGEQRHPVHTANPEPPIRATGGSAMTDLEAEREEAR
ncbi:hypothetical protein USDA257_c36050 [Sinorhizobium fredii USDA 257]|uniref:Uncharacterized protein n=1 Tax=Sinorhizobium fredii (strain USDA 257) TaxID=1185652 RepID=I3X8F6_SINF2|nr:hypothetical protein USDA257_c36050 [Sinorhizobium fredii USDA 257]